MADTASIDSFQGVGELAWICSRCAVSRAHVFGEAHSTDVFQIHKKIPRQHIDRKATDSFPKNDSKTPAVTCGYEGLSPLHLGRNVASRFGGKTVLPRRDITSRSEVAELCLERREQQDIRGLQIPVKDGLGQRV
eukprot:scaffold1185_cov238-Pinguiococcus_pyrenoidosus.AAC.4